jgi:hypothetical protein
MKENMQKWEYMTAQIWAVPSHGHLTGTVIAINGDAIGKLNMALNTKGGEPLEQFLSRVGAEGWEVVSSNSNGESCWVTVILKRQVE